MSFNGAVVSAAMLVACASGTAQTITWNAGSAPWNVAVNWSPANIPDNAAETAVLPAGAYTVNVPGGYSILSYGVGLGATLAIDNNASITTQSAAVTIDGELIINRTGGGNLTSLGFGVVNSTINGSGTITLNANPGNFDTGYISANGIVLTVGPGIRIRGNGRLYGAFINNGLVSSSVNGRTIDVRNNFTNNGVIEAINGGTLVLPNIIITQGANGVIQTSVTNLQLQATNIVGGTIDPIGSSQVDISGGVIFNGTASDGVLRIANNAALTFPNGLNHTGEIVVNTSGGGNATFLNIPAATTVSSPTTVTLNASGNLDTSYIQHTGGTTTWGANTLIHGTGRLYGGFINNGLISADVNGRVLDARNNFTNNGVIEAINGGTLVFPNIIVTQGANGVIETTTTNLQLQATTIVGGTIDPIGSSQVDISGGVTFNGTASDSVLRIANNSSLTFPSGLNHTGEIVVNATGGGNATFLSIPTATTVSSPTTVTLNASGNLDTSYIQHTGGTTTWSANTLIHGTGRLYGAFINDTRISSDVNGRTLDVRNNFTNNGAIEAINGGTLVFPNITITQGANGVIETTTTNLQLQATTIIGGTINPIGSSQIDIGGGVTFNGTASDGVLRIANNASLTFPNGLNHSGEIVVNTTAGGNQTILSIPTATTVSTPTTVTLNANAGNLDTSYIQHSGGATTWGPSTLIHGTGRLFGAFINNALISSDVNGRTLDVRNNFTNNGAIEAINGGTLVFPNITITQGANGVIKTEGTPLTLQATNVIGGTIDASAGSVNVAGGVTYQGLTSSGTTNIPNASSLTLNGVSHSGTILVNTSAGANQTVLYAPAGTSIDGAASIRLNANTGNYDTSYMNVTGAGSATLGTATSLGGKGRIYGNWIARGSIEPGFSAGDLQVMNSLTMQSTSTFKAQIGGTLAAQYDRVRGNGSGTTTTVDGTLEISLIDGFIPDTGAVFTVISNTKVLGTFDTVIAPQLDEGKFYVQYNGDSVVVGVICRFDFNADGFITGDDFDEFVVAFEQGDISADYNRDGFPNGDDFDLFIADFELGCE